MTILPLGFGLLNELSLSLWLTVLYLRNPKSSSLSLYCNPESPSLSTFAIDLSLSLRDRSLFLPSQSRIVLSLYLRNPGFDAVTSVGLEFYGNSSSTTKPFAALESLALSRMPNWNNWLMPPEDVEAFPNLSKISIDTCRSLMGELQLSWEKMKMSRRVFIAWCHICPFTL